MFYVYSKMMSPIDLHVPNVQLLSYETVIEKKCNLHSFAQILHSLQTD